MFRYKPVRTRYPRPWSNSLSCGRSRRCHTGTRCWRRGGDDGEAESAATATAANLRENCTMGDNFFNVEQVYGEKMVKRQAGTASVG